jgi:hypothetical protein
MGWLLRRGEVLASVDVLETAGEALRLLHSPDRGEGAVLCRSARLASGFGHGRGVDLAWLDDELVVQRTCHLSPFAVRVGGRGTTSALFAERGAFERWTLHAGDVLEVKD